MKSHSVKSNAKRLARSIAAAAPEKWEVAEPVRAPDGNWFPALRAMVAEHGGHDLAVIVNAGDFAKARQVISEEVQPDEDTAEIPRFLRRSIPALVPAGVTVHIGERQVAVAAEVTLPAGPTTVTLAKTQNVGKSEAPVPGLVAALAEEKAAKLKTAADAKALPARVVSTKEEIEARREARRQRIAAEKTSPSPAKAAKETRGDVIVKLCSRPEGATSEELQTATKWQRHTLRGYIAGTLRKRGHDIQLVRRKGEPSIYRIEPAA